MVSRPNTLRLLTPPAEQFGAERFTYPGLEAAVNEHYGQERDELMARATDLRTERIPLHGIKLSQRHLAVAALRMQQSSSHAEEKLWGQAFTDTSVGLYGQPDKKEALMLVKNDLQTFRQEYADRPKLRTKAVRTVLDTYQRVCDSTNDTIPDLSDVYSDDDVLLRSIKDALYARHGDVYGEIDRHEDEELLDVSMIYEEFSAMLEVLKQGDSSWNRWKVVLVDGAQMSVLGSKGEIRIGKNMPPLPVLRVKSLFTHEVLWHGQRGVNGRKYDKRLAYGMPGYRMSEEGGGGLVEGAVEGKMPYRFGDRYVDTAMAIGLASQPPMTRPDLAPIVYGRTLLRRASEGSPLDEEYIQTTTNQHLVRLYRGTPGTDTGGVFTRDIYYYRGYREMAYQFKQYPSMYVPNVLDFVLSGKIDFSEATQRRYLHDRKTGLVSDNG